MTSLLALIVLGVVCLLALLALATLWCISREYYERLRTWADPSRVIREPKASIDKDPARRLDEVEDALTWHRRRQARADAMRSGFWASVPMAMIALWWGLRQQITAIPMDENTLHDNLSSLWHDALMVFAILWLATRIGAAIIDHRSGGAVRELSHERNVLRSQLRAAKTSGHE